MDAHVSSPVPAAAFVWKRGESVFATVVCKLTFTLLPGTCVLSKRSEPLARGDQLYGDVDRPSVRIPNDFAPLKQKADVVVIGSVFAGSSPKTSVQARLGVGSCDKTIEVFTDRWFTQNGELIEAPPFQRVPLRWEIAAYGPGNPVGIRNELPDARGSFRVPQIQPPRFQVQNRSTRTPVIGLGPVSETWSVRHGKLPAGADPSSTSLRTSNLVETIDPAFFQVAPLDQQIAFIQPNERIGLEHLHPTHERLLTALPGAEPAAEIKGLGAVPMVGDTLWIDTDRGVCTVTYRGSLDVTGASFPLAVTVALEGPEAIELFYSEETSDEPNPEQRPVGKKPDTMPFAADRNGSDAEVRTEAGKSLFPHNQILSPPDATIAIPAVPPMGFRSTPPSAPPPPSGAGTTLFQSPLSSPPLSSPPLPRFGPAPLMAVPGSDNIPGTPFHAAQPAALPAMMQPAFLQSQPAMPPAMVPLAHAPAASAYDASNLAAQQEGTSHSADADLSSGVGSLRSRNSYDLLWFDPAVVRRLRVCHAELLGKMPFSTKDPKHEMMGDNAEFDQTRAEVFYCLTQADPAELALVQQLAREGTDEFGRFVPPLIILETDIRLAFSEAERLRTTVQIVKPFCAMDPKLKQTVDQAAAFTDAAVPVVPTIATRLYLEVRDQFHASCAKLGGASMLDSEVDRLLVEGRSIDQRTLFGGQHGRLLVGSQADAIVVYLGQEGIAKLPLMDQFRGRLLAEIHPRQDRGESNPFALKALAIARTVSEH